MHRFSWLAPLLGWLILGGCGSSDDDADGFTSESTRADLSFAVSAPRCEIDGATAPAYLATLGEPVVVTIASASVTESCSSCTTTTNNGWSCSQSRHCEREYDLGGPNLPECHETRRIPTTLGSATVTVDGTPQGGATRSVPVFYSERGVCPPPEGDDAGTPHADAGDAADADADADE